jgi:hypothetical protein
VVFLSRRTRTSLTPLTRARGRAAAGTSTRSADGGGASASTARTRPRICSTRWLSPSRCRSGWLHHYMESGMLKGIKERAEGTLGAA